MGLTDAFFSDHGDVKLLVSAEQNDRDGILLLSIIVFVDNWHDRTLVTDSAHIIRSDKQLVTVG